MSAAVNTAAAEAIWQRARQATDRGAALQRAIAEHAKLEGAHKNDFAEVVWAANRFAFGLMDGDHLVTRAIDKARSDWYASRREARGNVRQLRPDAGVPAATLKIADMVPTALDRAERRRSGDELPVPLLFPAYAKILGGGLWPGVHMKVAGTGVGKTTLALQESRYALEQGVPTLYVGLELDRDQLALRMIADKANIPWSRLYTGQATENQMLLAREASKTVSALPFECEFSKPQGWQASSLLASLGAMRKAHPKGPLLAVVDFLQLVGREASTGSQDLRERIGEAAYMATHAANTYDAAIQLISSTARDKYALLDSSLSEAGLCTVPAPGGIGRVRAILKPGVLVGLGKESGEIEYSASSVTVLSRWPTRLENGEKLIIAAVPKLRWGPESWFALRFGHRFEEYPANDISDLPEIPKGKQPISSDELENRLLATLEKGTYANKSELVKATTGDRNKLLAKATELMDAGRLVVKDGSLREV